MTVLHLYLKMLFKLDLGLVIVLHLPQLWNLQYGVTFYCVVMYYADVSRLQTVLKVYIDWQWSWQVFLNPYPYPWHLYRLSLASTPGPDAIRLYSHGQIGLLESQTSHNNALTKWKTLGRKHFKCILFTENFCIFSWILINCSPRSSWQ